MMDFRPLLSQPVFALLGAAGQLGIFATLILATLVGFPLNQAASIAVIGAIDGPTSICVSSLLAPELLAPDRGDGILVHEPGPDYSTAYHAAADDPGGETHPDGIRTASGPAVGGHSVSDRRNDLGRRRGPRVGSPSSQPSCSAAF